MIVLKNKIKKYSNLIENFIALYLLKIANILIPLATLPYLVRVLGVEKFGLVSFAQVFAGFFVMAVDFGFELSMVREISINSDDKNKVSKILSNAIAIKIILIAFASIVYTIIISLFYKFNQNYDLYLYMYGIVIGQGLRLTWFFQGIQKMRYITILNISVKIFFLILIFVLIHRPQDYLMYPILLSLGYIGVLPFAYYLVYKRLGYTFIAPNIKSIIYYIKYSSHFFVSRVAVTIYDMGGLFIVGMISNDLITGYYAIADKLRSAITKLYSPISAVLYPYIAKDKNIRIYKKIFMMIMILNFIGLSILFIFAPRILDIIFGSHADLSVLILRIFSIVMLIDIPSIFLGYPLLGAFGYTNFVNYSVVAVSIIYVIFILILYFLNFLNAQMIAISYLFAVSVELLIRVYGVIKYRLWRIK